MKITELLEAKFGGMRYTIKVADSAKGKDARYVVAMKKADGSLKGYFVSDDQPQTKSVKRALKYATKKEAQDDADNCNKTWELYAGEKFVVVPNPELKEELAEEWRDHMSANRLKTIEKNLDDVVRRAEVLKRYDDLDQGAVKSMIKNVNAALEDLYDVQKSVDNIKEEVLTEAETPTIVLIHVGDDGQDYYEGARDALLQLGFKDQGTVLDFVKKLKDVAAVKNIDLGKNKETLEGVAVFAKKKPAPQEVFAHYVKHR